MNRIKENEIICGDSEEILKMIDSGSVDIIITSPPYNFGKNYDLYKDKKSHNEYFSKLFSIFDECIRVLKIGGRFCINIMPEVKDYIPTHHIISNYLLSKGLLWKTEIIWDKNNYNCNYTTWGSWKSPSNPYIKISWEYIEIFCKGSFKKEGKNENIDISSEEFRKWTYGKWEIRPEVNMKNFNHPAMSPEELVVRLLKLFSYKGDLVLDPFNGVGTTTLVACKLDRKYIGIDISEEYCKIAKKRIEDYKSQLKLF